MNNPEKGSQVEYKGKKYLYNGKNWYTTIGGHTVEVPDKDPINEALKTEYIKLIGSPTPTVPKPSKTPDDRGKPETNLNRGLADIMKKQDALAVDEAPQLNAVTPLASLMQTAAQGGLDKTMSKDGGLTTGMGNAPTGIASQLSGLSQYLPDVFKATLGLAGASKKLPEFETPQYLLDYGRKLQELSTQGLTDTEISQAMRGADRNYAYDVNNVERFSGGRPGVALANLGRAANTLQDAYGNINLADAQMQRQNLAQYGNFLNTRLGLDQSRFDQKYNEAVQSKMAGANLAADALSNIDQRAEYNKFYGDDSTYGKYMQSLTEGQRLANEQYQYQLNNAPDIAGMSIQPQTINSNAQLTLPQFWEQYYGK